MMAKKGVATQMTTTVPSTPRRHRTQDRRDMGMASSTVKMSFRSRRNNYYRAAKTYKCFQLANNTSWTMFRTRKAIIAISPWQLNANTQSYFWPFFQLHCALKHNSKTQTLLWRTVSRTFANRLTTLPVGVVSKNIMGTRMMLFSSLECRMRDALTEELAMSRVPAKTKIPGGKSRDFLD